MPMATQKISLKTIFGSLIEDFFDDVGIEQEGLDVFSAVRIRFDSWKCRLTFASDMNRKHLTCLSQDMTRGSRFDLRNSMKSETRGKSLSSVRVFQKTMRLSNRSRAS